ncbi:MAG: SRPBCC family protein [Proteobacteria bacterium]|nr:SRPBCC family protein [Pseudomonadota bacterium]
MKRLLTVLFIFLCSSVYAHGPTPQKLEQTISIIASPEMIWAVIGDFQAIAKWHPMIENVTGEGNEPSAERKLTLKEKEGVIVESLDEYDADNFFYSYRLLQEDIDVVPVSFHSSRIEIIAVEKGLSKVNWSARFYRADTGNFPPEQYSDQAAIDAMEEFAITGLTSLKTLVEGGQ